MTQILPINQVKVGMVIIKVSAQNGPVKIKKSGLVSSEDMIKALAEMGVQEVEIDPDMTVEIKKNKVAKSKTQRLLEDTSNANQNIDNGISEQFNRSLFLPSVQELPEAWQYYGKKSAVVLFITTLGFAAGWLAANADNWQLATAPNVAVTPPPETDTPQSDSLSETEKVAEPALLTNNVESPEQTSAEDNESAKQAELAQIDSSQAGNLQTNTAPATEPVEPEQLEVLNAPVETTDDPVDVPPELVRRFQDVLDAMGDKSVPDPVEQAQPKRDVPTIEQLPAWAQTQLPSMAFSAHMYVSEKSQRWVRVNGKRVQEGQEIEEGLRVTGIEPQHVILTFRGQEFSMDALTDW